MTPDEIINRLESIAASAQTAHYDVAEMARVAPVAAALIREMREVLKKNEWTRRVDDVSQKYCPWCGNIPSWDQAPDCRLAQMLKD